ncbi:hypothetical protein [Kitasatospora sp. NBC_01300]|uniref:hypothetical protein n=1 Tax=Kitasatospora sp. NBC_01300 TaxID=2903574 RepID=UPI002F907DEB|nr:hypothetical protein OG556_40305 [Kitasatospora sp. NBC_01300]
MTRNETPEANPPLTREALKFVAADPVAFDSYLGDVYGTLVTLRKAIGQLAQEVQVELRGTEVPGDRFYDAWVRARPVEGELKSLIKNLEKTAKSLEKATLERRSYDEKVAALPVKRSAKALKKANKSRSKSLPVNKSAGQVPLPQKSSYSEPRTMFDLNDRRSA